MFCSCHTILQLSEIYWQIFKFIFKRVTVLLMIQKAAARWNEPISKLRMSGSVSCLVTFIGVVFAALLLRCLPVCFCHSCTSSLLSASSITLITTCVLLSHPHPNVTKPCCHSCGVRRLSVFKHVCPLTCFAPDVPPCSR